MCACVVYKYTLLYFTIDLSVLELTLLVAIRHHMEISSKPFNFEMIYKGIARCGTIDVRLQNVLTSSDMLV